MVTLVDSPNRQIIVKHGDIPGFMPAMTMPFSVREVRELNGLAPGDVIRANLVVGDQFSYLEGITVVKKSSVATPSAQAGQHFPVKGETVPDFHLADQDGRPVQFDQFRGKALLVTFFYTRCPLPDFCPLMNANFSRVLTLLGTQQAVLQRTQLLSISFDPDHDTPAALKRYASHYLKSVPGVTAGHWQFAVSSKHDLSDMAKFFGLGYQTGEGQIAHTLSTTVIAPDGKVDRWYHGNAWSPDEVAGVIRSLLSSPR